MDILQSAGESIGHHPVAVASLQNNRRLVITVEGNQPHCDFVTESGTVAIGTDKGLFVHQFDDSLPMQVITRNATFGIERLPDAILTLERQEFPESNNINQLNAHRDHPTRLVYREAPSLNATKSVAVLGTPNSLHISQDKSIALISMTQWPVRIWQLADNRKSSNVVLLPAPIVAQRFSPDSEKITVVSSDSTKLSYNLKSQRSVTTRLPGLDSVAVCDISADGHLIVATDSSGRMVAVSEQKLIVADLTVKDPHSIPRSIEISPNGHKMAIVSSQGLTLWDTLDAEPSRADFFPASEVLHTLWQNDSKTLFAVIQPPESNSNSIARVDTEQRIISSPPTPNDVYCLFPCPAHSAPGIVTLAGAVFVPGSHHPKNTSDPQYQQLIHSGAIRSSAGAVTDEIVVSTNDELLIFNAPPQTTIGPVSYRVRAEHSGQMQRTFAWNERALRQIHSDWLLHVGNDTIERWPRDLSAYAGKLTLRQTP